MKLLKAFVLCLFASCPAALAGEGLVTLTASPGITNQVQITSSQTFRGVAMSDNCGNAQLLVQKDSKTFVFNAGQMASVVMAGPAAVSLGLDGSLQPSCQSFVTLDIQPAPFPPGRAVTVGAYSGNVQVTMEMSTDLVNWTPAVNGLVYTNAPDARFFRIKLVTNATP